MAGTPETVGRGKPNRRKIPKAAEEQSGLKVLGTATKIDGIYIPQKIHGITRLNLNTGERTQASPDQPITVFEKTDK